MQLSPPVPCVCMCVALADEHIVGVSGFLLEERHQRTNATQWVVIMTVSNDEASRFGRASSG